MKSIIWKPKGFIRRLMSWSAWLIIQCFWLQCLLCMIRRSVVLFCVIQNLINCLKIGCLLKPFKGRFIPPIWMHLIKDVISYMSNIDNLAASLGSIDSYVLETKPERIKVILFPFESREVNWRKDFATFLIEHLRNKWKSTMLDHFINILQKDFKIGYIQHHPLLQDFNQLSNMIRMTWKESKYLTVERRVLLSSTLNAIRNNIPWTSVTTMDAVVNEYISKATNDSLGLFMEIKKIAAHYIENRRKLNKEKGICNRKQVHPIEIIEEIWPGAIEEIYELSLKSEWLMT
ncbi:hypothetical protein DAI22_02g055600 [Oryza sativa Japonica Group]|nr:hypothetical protein DAI22_02g055600 [Oryza sativa Japonica Group]